MDKPASAASRRKSQVFVQIPPSPYSIKSTKSDRADNPENTPLKTVAMNVDKPSSTVSSTKRKAVEEPQNMANQMDDTQAPRPKKTKTEQGSNAEPTDKKRVAGDALDASKAEKTPAVRCHQCTRHIVDSAGGIHCTFKRPNGQRCLLKYCKACLRNRYGQDLDDIKSHSIQNGPEIVKAEHVDEVDFLFQCPRCSDRCNCRYCRKAKGLPATGNLSLIARKAEKEAKDGASIEDHVSPTPKNKSRESSNKISASGKATEPKPRNRKVKEPASSKAKEAVKGKNAKDVARPNASKAKPKPHVLIPPSPYKIKPPPAPAAKIPRTLPPKPVAAPKPVPKPVWTIISTPLTRDEAVRRMNIREFLLRFGHLADIARTHLEELEDLYTANPYTDAADDEDEESDGPCLVGWIGEPALRAILIGLMSLFSKDADVRDEDSSAFTKAAQRIRASGVNLNKMWNALDSLRDETDLTIPDPLPPPSHVMQRSTRTRESSSAAHPVVTTAQLINVVAALVEAALQTKPVQEDFERAVTQEKDLSRAARELTTAENTRFRELKSAEAAAKPKKADKHNGSADKSNGKSALEGVKVPLAVRRVALAEHETLLANFDCAHRIAVSECIARFGPLGRDTEGRVYYAITPGVTERDAAIELLEGGGGEVKFGRRRVAELEERKRMKHWSWFIAIWGRKPDGADVAKLEDHEDGEEGVDEDAEQWWAFWQPEEITRLAEWLAMKYGINLEAKRPGKSLEDSTVVDVDGADTIPKLDADKKSRGRPSDASAAPSARSSLGHDSDSDASSELEDSGDEQDRDGDVQMRLDKCGEPVPTRRDLRNLARGLKDYAVLLEWRIKRAAKDIKDAKDGAGDKEEKVDKGKGVARSGPIPPAQFYGK